jgi:AraC family L-rhamnose operon transcriptional activator RhaR
VNCCFRARLLERELLWLAEEPHLNFLLWPRGRAGDGVVRTKLPPDSLEYCVEMLGRLAEPPPQDPRPYQLAYLLLLLRHLAGHLDSQQRSDAKRLADAPTAVVEALSMMAADMGRPWSVEALASTVAVSPAHLSRLFTATVGRPPMAHLSVLRAEAAATLLLRGLEPVSTVGAAVGWGDPNYFARRFRAHFGTSPTAYRRRARARSA